MKLIIKNLASLAEFFLKENDRSHGELWRGVIAKANDGVIYIQSTANDIETWKVKLVQDAEDQCFQSTLREGDVVAFTVEGDVASVHRITRVLHKKDKRPFFMNFEEVKGSNSPGLIPNISRRQIIHRRAAC